MDLSLVTFIDPATFITQFGANKKPLIGATINGGNKIYYHDYIINRDGKVRLI